MGKRVISTIVLWAVIFVILRVFRTAGAVVLLSLMSGLTLREFYRMQEGAGRAPFTWMGMLFGTVITAAPYLETRFGWPAHPLLALIVVLVALRILSERSVEERADALGSTVFGLVYIGVLLQYLVRIATPLPGDAVSPDGRILLVVWVVAVAKFCDTGALLSGMAFGKHPMAPKISPKKTWEGAVGGVAISAGVGALVAWLARGELGLFLPPARAAWIAVPIAAVAIVSDLIESILKRQAARKDSGTTIPGIGGVFDVTDSLLLAAPVGYILLGFPVTSDPRKGVVLLGATGSIGENALRVLEAHPDKLRLVGIAARTNSAKLAAIAREFDVRDVAIFDEKACREAKRTGQFPPGTRLKGGLEGLVELARLPEARTILVAVVGTIGLEPALAALAAGKELALASKEILVLAGRFVTEAAVRAQSRILPIDSEHNAIFQCLDGKKSEAVRRIVLTASGGAFRDWPVERLVDATPTDALRHPNWAMGPKITVDSATLANKGLELIEAQWLFGLAPAQCDAVLHPQSIVHGLVEFADGSFLAQLCPPSMTFPIQHALLYPERVPGPETTLDLTRALTLEFKPVDSERFPLLRLAKAAMKTGGTAPAVYNAANEVAVHAFLAEQIPFLAISHVVEQTLAVTSHFEPTDLAAVLDADAEARRLAEAAVARAAARPRTVI